MNIENRISNWLYDYLIKSNLECFVIGVSGGIDSALTSTICCETGLKTIVVTLPIHQHEDQLDRAKKHINWLTKKYDNVTSIDIDLSNLFENFKSLFIEKNQLALANSRSRLRMVTLYHISSLNRGLVVGTGNKIEDFGIGFFTKYGDGGVDISPIADLTKSEVRELSKKMNIIEEIINAKPTDGLWDDDRSDEEQIGASYEELEWAMDFKGDKDQLSNKEINVLNIYKKLNQQNKHKITPIPVFKK